MKNKLIIISIFFSLVTIATIGAKITNSYKVASVSLMFANLEALASATEGDGEFKCYIHKDQCIVSAKTELELGALNRILRKLGMGEVGLNISVDLSDATCLYSPTPNGPLVRCGTDKRCADIWSF